MRYKICLSIGRMDPDFKKMVETLRKYADVDVVGLDGFSLSGYHIFIGKKMSEETCATANCLKAAFAYKTGVDNFPLKSLQKKGIVLINSHADADYIAEYAMGLLVSLLYKIPESDKKLRQGIWRDPRNLYWKSVFQTKVGLLGYGEIGKHVHQILQHNGIETYTIDRGKSYENIHLVDSLETLCKETDVLVISLPKTPDTNRIINRKILRLLKDKYIVNVGRSNCIDQSALFDALKSRKLAGAAIDAWDKKPKHMLDKLIPFDYPFHALDNIILSPHQAMQVSDGHTRYVEDITQKVIDYISTGKITDSIDFNKGY